MKSRVAPLFLLIFFLLVTEVIGGSPETIQLKSNDHWFFTNWFWTLVLSIVIFFQFIAILIALIYVGNQVKRQKLANMISSFESVNKRWECTEMVKARKEFCDKCYLGAKQMSRTEEMVIGFFDDFGLYLEYGIFDLKIIWHKYSRSIEYYWAASRPMIRYMRKIEGESFYHHFDYLYNQIVQFSQSLSPPKYVSDKSPTQIQQFCAEECQWLKETKKVN